MPLLLSLPAARLRKLSRNSAVKTGVFRLALFLERKCGKFDRVKDVTEVEACYVSDGFRIGVGSGADVIHAWLAGWALRRPSENPCRQ